MITFQHILVLIEWIKQIVKMIQIILLHVLKHMFEILLNKLLEIIKYRLN